MPDFAPLHGPFTVLHGWNREWVETPYSSKRSGWSSRFPLHGLHGCVHTVDFIQVHGCLQVVLHTPHTPIGAMRRLWAACALIFSNPHRPSPILKGADHAA
jgi:hypothetical protein